MKKIFKKIFGVIVLLNLIPVVTGLFFFTGTFWDCYINGFKVLGIIAGIFLGAVLVSIIAGLGCFYFMKFINWAFDTDF